LKTGVKGIKLTALDEIFTEDDDREKVIELEVSILTAFKNHPFKAEDNGDMELLSESVKQYGVLVPVVVREVDGIYELVSGHRRKRAAEIAGISTIPAIVRELDDDEAVIIMVDSNLQRERILPSEKAWAYRLKYDAIKRKIGRPQKIGQVVPIMQGKTSAEVIGESVGESEKQIKRYMRLTELLPEFLNMVDEKKLSFIPAVELSYLKMDEQTELLKFISETEIVPSLSQSQRLKKFSQEDKLTADIIEAVMSEEKAEPLRFAMNKTTLSRYFPKEYTARQIESTILELLENRQKSQTDAVTA
jgi:ParB family chromosome partitioning protein